MGSTVEVTSRFVPTPAQVRYTWWRDGRGNLYSAVRIPIQGGKVTYTRLPASPFEMTLGTGNLGRQPAPL